MSSCCVVHREGFERAAPHVHVGQRRQARARRAEHLGRGVHGDDARDIGRDQRAELAGAAPEIAHPQAPIEHRQHRFRLELLAEELGPQAIPLARGRREELRRLRPPLGQRRFGAARVLFGGRGVTRLLADERPETRRRLIERCRQPVVARGAVAARGHPVVVGQRLQVAADGGLRQLHDGAEFGDGQFVPLEQQQHPAAHGVGQHRHVLEQPGHAAAVSATARALNLIHP